MASKNTSSSPNGRQKVQRSNSDSARWVAGLLLLFIGLFAASAVLFSFFTWAADQSGLLLSPEERATLGVEPGNLCGWAGARLGRLLVDNSFGVSGILIPVMVLLVGVRVIRQRPLLFNHSILSLFLVLILSSLTLGFAFSDKWSLCSSTGWGGAFGIETAALLRTHIGVLGTLILLLGCWILTGVFINRNFINKVNRAGNVMVDKSGRIVEIVKHKVVHAHGQPSDAAGDAAAVAAESVGNPGERPAKRSADTPAVESAVKAEPEVVVRRPEPELAVQRPVPEMPRAVRTPGPAAAGTPAAEAEGLIAEVGAADSPAAMRTTIRSWNWAPTACPLCPKPRRRQRPPHPMTTASLPRSTCRAPKAGWLSAPAGLSSWNAPRCVLPPALLSGLLRPCPTNLSPNYPWAGKTPSGHRPRLPGCPLLPGCPPLPLLYPGSRSPTGRLPRYPSLPGASS